MSTDTHQLLERIAELEREAEQMGVAELAQANEELRQRDRILEATATVANVLLTIDTLDKAVNMAIRIMGEALDTDRVTIIETFEPPINYSSLPHWRVLYEWVSAHAELQLRHPDQVQGTHEGIEEWYASLSQGESVSCRLEDMPEPFRGGQAAIGVKVLHGVPIFVEGQYWGAVVFDDCREAKQRSDVEVAMLKVAADCIGSAIQRDRNQRAFLQVETERATKLAKTNEELKQRDRLLSAVARMTQDLLENPQLPEAVTRALQQMGVAAGISRVILMQEKLDETSHELQHHVVYEWNAPGIPRQMDAPVTCKVSNREYGVLVDTLHQGQSIWHVLEDLPEPAQTQQADIAVKSTGAVPIFIEGIYFGCVGFDDCVTYRRWSAPEIDVLISGAGAIGAALHRKQLVERLVQEQIQAEQKRASELAEANAALQRSLDRLATEPTLDSFLSEIVIVMATQFHTPLVEYWHHGEGMAQVRIVAYENAIYRHSEIVRVFPTHPGLKGLKIPPAKYLGVATSRISWLFPDEQPGSVITKDNPYAEYIRQNCPFELYLPIILGDKSLGSLIVRLPNAINLDTQQIELIQALTHQATLAIQLTQLAEENRQTAILEERNRLAGEIHDTLAQTFTSIALQLELVQYLIQHNPTEAKSVLTQISDLAQSGLTEARRSVWALHPDSQNYADLQQNLLSAIAQLTDSTPLQTHIKVQGTPYLVPPLIGKNLLRIGQEAIANVLKHAQATHLWVELAYESDNLHLRVRDDGCGFALQQDNGGFGLLSMADRAERMDGQMTLNTQPGQGTEILIQVTVQP